MVEEPTLELTTLSRSRSKAMIQLTEQNRIDLIDWLRAGAVNRVLKALECLNHVEQGPVGKIVDDFDGWTKPQWFKKPQSGAFLFAAAGAWAVPEGYQLVPIEPTDQLIELLYGPYLSFACHESRKKSYTEMLEAAGASKS